MSKAARRATSPFPTHAASILYDAALRLAKEAQKIVRMPSPQQAQHLRLAEMVRAHRHRVLEACGGNRSLAAQLLGVHRRTFQRQLESDAARARRGKARRTRR